MKYVLLIITLISLVSCKTGTNQHSGSDTAVKGDIIIFHAGSLSVPFQKIARAFENENPGTRVLLEAAGSVDCARKITDLHKPCDLMASSDYKVITKFLIPNYTTWYLPFAGNEMIIAYTEKSISADAISKDNWIETLLNDQVHYGRSDPDADPCGYRTIMLMQLAAEHYNHKNLVEELSAKDVKYVRPKEVDLLSLLELHETDYLFIYRSVAIQHNLKFLELPDEINLKNVELNEHYNTAVVNIKGKDPSSTVTVNGEAITYAITLLDNAPNQPAARAFLEFLLNADKGIKILTEAGHNSLIPVPENSVLELPDFLKKFTKEKI
jgi:molybdate/tungstate transport system substrate-binding protein